MFFLWGNTEILSVLAISIADTLYKIYFYTLPAAVETAGT